MTSHTLLSGSQAIVEGAIQAGTRFVSGFAGTPTTKILSTLQKSDRVLVQMTPNEKVALDVALGMAQGGRRAMTILKHIGLNIAADPLIASAYAGVNAGLVVISIDDPGLLFSMNEQDTRYFARAAKIPILAPSDSREMIEFIALAYKLSEAYDLPVIVRSTTRLCLTRSTCSLPASAESAPSSRPIKQRARMDGVERHAYVEKQLSAIEAFGNQAFELNTIDVGSPNIGIITSGIAYSYAKEVLPDASFLKIGMIHPLPHKLITYFASLVKRLYVIEELDPYLEEQIRAVGVTVIGKDTFPRTGELSPDIIAKCLASEGTTFPPALVSKIELPARQSSACIQCAHHGFMRVFQKLNLDIVGDMGCFLAGDLPPANPSDLEACFCIGASMSIAFGTALATSESESKRTVIVLSTTTFMHSGLPALANIVQNGGTATICLLASDGAGRSTATTSQVDFAKLCEGVGVQNILIINTNDDATIEHTLLGELEKPGVSVIISKPS